MGSFFPLAKGEGVWWLTWKQWKSIIWSKCCGKLCGVFPVSRYFLAKLESMLVMLAFSPQHSWMRIQKKHSRDPLSGDKWAKTGSWQSMNDKCRFDEPNSVNQKKFFGWIFYSTDPVWLSLSFAISDLRISHEGPKWEAFSVGNWWKERRVEGAKGNFEFLIFTLVSFPFHPLCLRLSPSNAQPVGMSGITCIIIFAHSLLVSNKLVKVNSARSQYDQRLNWSKTVCLPRISNRWH